MTINQLANYGRKPLGHLPEIQTVNKTNQVVQVINEKTGQVEYTVRMAGTRFKPMVFAADTYTLRVGDPDLSNWKTLTGLQMAAQDTVLPVRLEG